MKQEDYNKISNLVYRTMILESEIDKISRLKNKLVEDGNTNKVFINSNAFIDDRIEVMPQDVDIFKIMLETRVNELNSINEEIANINIIIPEHGN
jgi:hypothetical protein